MRDIRYERKESRNGRPQVFKKVPREKFKHQMVKLYNNGKSMSKILKECSTLHCWVRAIHKSGPTRVACKQDP